MTSSHESNPRKIKKLIIYIKDIEILMGKGESAARRLLAKIKRKLGKEKDCFVSIPEFCRVTGLSEDEVNQRLP